MVHPIIVPSDVMSIISVNVRDKSDTPFSDLMCHHGPAADVQYHHPVGGKIQEIVDRITGVYEAVRLTELAEHRIVVPFHVYTELVLYTAFTQLAYQLSCQIYWRGSLWWHPHARHVTPAFV